MSEDDIFVRYTATHDHCGFVAVREIVMFEASSHSGIEVTVVKLRNGDTFSIRETVEEFCIRIGMAISK